MLAAPFFVRVNGLRLGLRFSRVGRSWQRRSKVGFTGYATYDDTSCVHQILPNKLLQLRGGDAAEALNVLGEVIRIL